MKGTDRYHVRESSVGDFPRKATRECNAPPKASSRLHSSSTWVPGGRVVHSSDFKLERLTNNTVVSYWYIPGTPEYIHRCQAGTPGNTRVRTNRPLLRNPTLLLVCCWCLVWYVATRYLIPVRTSPQQ